MKEENLCDLDCRGQSLLFFPANRQIRALTVTDGHIQTYTEASLVYTFYLLTTK